MTRLRRPSAPVFAVLALLCAGSAPAGDKPGTDPRWASGDWNAVS